MPKLSKTERIAAFKRAVHKAKGKSKTERKAIFKAEFAAIKGHSPGNPGKTYHKKRGGNMAKKKKHGRKKTIVKTIDKVVTTALVLFPEIRAVSDCIRYAGFEKFPQQWIRHRTGFDIEAGTLNEKLFIENYMVPLTALALYKVSKKIGVLLR